MANYNFWIFYRSGKSNIDADALSRIPWEVTQVDHEQTGPIVKSLMLTWQVTTRVPHLPNAVIPVKELIVRTDYQLSKSQWREEQTADPIIKRVIDLIHEKRLGTYNCQKTDPNDLKGFVRLKKDLFIDNRLLYRKAYF